MVYTHVKSFTITVKNRKCNIMNVKHVYVNKLF